MLHMFSTFQSALLPILQSDIDGETERILRDVTDRQAKINDLTRQIDALDSEQETIFKDQERVRRNLSELRQNPLESSLRQRYIRQFESQENRIEAIENEREKLESEQDVELEQLETFIQKISIDRKL